MTIESGKPILILEYIENGTLLQFLVRARGVGLSEKVCKYFYLQMLEALEFCHQNKILHHDVNM